MSSRSQLPDRGSLETQSEMLPQDPPPHVVRWIAWLMVAMFAAALTGAIVVQVPETVRSPFVLVPDDGADPVGAPIPHGSPRARVTLQEQGLSRLAVGQRVRLFFEAFPYERYGTITGTLEWISPAAVASAGGPRFIALVSPSQNFVLVRQEPRPLQVGMTGEARIVVGHRRLIAYAFEPIRELRENMRR